MADAAEYAGKVGSGNTTKALKIQQLLDKFLKPT
jgi:hypothetical protein